MAAAEGESFRAVRPEMCDRATKTTPTVVFLVGFARPGQESDTLEVVLKVVV